MSTSSSLIPRLPLIKWLWIWIVAALVLAVSVLTNSFEMKWAIQDAIGDDGPKMILQFLFASIVGGGFLALIGARKDQDAQRESRARAIEALNAKLRESYRSLKGCRRRLRSQRIAGKPLPAFECKQFEQSMEELLTAQLALEEVEDSIEINEALLSEASTKRILAAVHYAQRYFHDVYEDFEKGRVSRRDGTYATEADCLHVLDLMTDAKPPENVKECYQRYKNNALSLWERDEELRQIIEQLKKDEEEGKVTQRYRKIAYQCIRVASEELSVSSAM